MRIIFASFRLFGNLPDSKDLLIIMLIHVGVYIDT